jgi:N-acetylneuraminate synthase
MVEAIRKSGCIPMATPFDEKSVDWCVQFRHADHQDRERR